MIYSIHLMVYKYFSFMLPDVVKSELSQITATNMHSEQRHKNSLIDKKKINVKN